MKYNNDFFLVLLEKSAHSSLVGSTWLSEMSSERKNINRREALLILNTQSHTCVAHKRERERERERELYLQGGEGPI